MYTEPLMITKSLMSASLGLSTSSIIKTLDGIQASKLQEVVTGQIQYCKIVQIHMFDYLVFHEIQYECSYVCWLGAPGSGGRSTIALWNFVLIEQSPRTAKVTLLLAPSNSYLGIHTSFFSFVLKSGIKSTQY